jgi:hypothetical protein
VARYDVTMGETLVCGIELPAFWTINGIARRCVGSKPLTKRMPSPALGLGNARVCAQGESTRGPRWYYSGSFARSAPAISLPKRS